MRRAEAMKPSPILLAKLGAMVIHASEVVDPAGCTFDHESFHRLLKDEEVKEWLEKMGKLSLIPRKQ